MTTKTLRCLVLTRDAAIINLYIRNLSVGRVHSISPYLPFVSRLFKLSLTQRHQWETKQLRREQHSDAQLFHRVPNARSVIIKYSLYPHSLVQVSGPGTPELSSNVSPWIEKVGGNNSTVNIWLAAITSQWKDGADILGRSYGKLHVWLVLG